MLIMENRRRLNQDPYLELEHTKERWEAKCNAINDIATIAGLNNSITYKNLNLSFILDMRDDALLTAYG
jgi:hypothetical protein